MAFDVDDRVKLHVKGWRGIITAVNGGSTYEVVFDDQHDTQMFPTGIRTTIDSTTESVTIHEDCLCNE